MIIHPFTYFKNKKLIEQLYPKKWIINIKETKLEQFYLINNSKIKHIQNNLKNNNYHLYTWDGIDNSFIWIKYFYYKNFKKKFSLQKNKHTLLTK